MTEYQIHELRDEDTEDCHYRVLYDAEGNIIR